MRDLNLPLRVTMLSSGLLKTRRPGRYNRANTPCPQAPGLVISGTRRLSQQYLCDRRTSPEVFQFRLHNAPHRPWPFRPLVSYPQGMKNDELLAVGRKIRSLREALNLSQEAMAQSAGLDRAYYGGIERGERNVSTLNLIEIARALNVEVGDLFPRIAELRKDSHGRRHTT